jgi:hypothetical protein
MIWPEETGAFLLSCFHAAPHRGGEGGFWLRRHGGSGGGVFGVCPGHAFLPYILAGTEVCPDFLKGFDAAELASREILVIIFGMGLLSAYAAGAVTMLVGFLVGLPLYLASRRLRRGNARLYAVVGGMISLLLCAMLLALQDTGFEIFVALRFPLAAILLAGPVAALTFRYVVVHLSRQGR